ncbi:hypothetical protein GCM10011450_24500 [Advenella faeciporci]|uniref:Lysozyme inhibitor LprI-like N-terminal domain-containing protein n=1 Tax=Advenella faeciporci TaxID=797535 RepID=A0A918N1B4_9BURK|nr:lysozyme inhibitor LprI family protein [Advenella faeciporci]GGW93540.1 hypothetical protein GCM10011450_24500 [Advenella faeciporci]
MKPLYLLLAIPALLLSTGSQAQMFNQEYEKCNQNTTVSIVDCVNKQAKKWDTRLNKSYKALMERSDAAQQAPLKSAQRQWIQYRDANCQFYALGDGSISQINAAECLRAMTQERTCEIEAANRYEGGPQAGCK